MSPGHRSIAVRELLESAQADLPLTVWAGESGLDRMVRGARVQKSGLALVGHFHGIEPGRIQVLGVTEMRFLKQLPDDKCRAAIQRLFERDLCCVVVTESDNTIEPGSACAQQLAASADELETPLLLCPLRSSHTINSLHDILGMRLAPRTRVHGALLDVFEVGLLLLGSSGVGKSEVALELVMRGHRLVADDVVECHYRHPSMVFGEAANLLRHHLEVRGLGILNIKDLFGVTAVREHKRIDVVVKLAEQATEQDYDRLGLEQRHYNILDVEIPELLVPVRPGRDMASIMEIAARNELLKRAGHDPARAFVERLEGALVPNSEDRRDTKPAPGSHATPRPSRAEPSSNAALSQQPLSQQPLSQQPLSQQPLSQQPLSQRPFSQRTSSQHTSSQRTSSQRVHSQRPPRPRIPRAPESIVGYPWLSKK